MSPELSDAIRDRLREWTYALGGPGTRARLEKLTPPRNEYGVDPYGFDVDYTVAAVAPLLWLYRKYFRVQVHGIEHVPAEGRVLLVSNHSGQLPFDGAMIEVAFLLDRDPPRAVRALMDTWVPTLPFVSTFMARCGQVVGTPENCRRLLAADEALLVFPEGTRGLNKLFTQRYQLQQFGLGLHAAGARDRGAHRPGRRGGRRGAGPGALRSEAARQAALLPGLPAHADRSCPSRSRPATTSTSASRCAFQGSPDEDDEQLEHKVAEVEGAVRALIARGLAERRHVFW